MTLSQVQELEACAAPNWLLMSLADRCLREACAKAYPADALICLEISLHYLHYLHPARGPLTACVDLLERSGQLLFASATVLDAHGRSCLRSTATFSCAAVDYDLGETAASSSHQPLN